MSHSVWAIAALSFVAGVLAVVAQQSLQIIVFKQAAPPGLAALALSAIGLVSCTAAAAETQLFDLALDVQPLEPTSYHALKHKRLLFATTRAIAQNAENAARSKEGGSYRYEDVFQETLSPLLAYGWVEVAFPSNREFGAQSYSDDPLKPNPFKYFAIEGHGFVSTRQDAQKLVLTQGYDPTQRALVFVHGINNSFRDAVEHLTQLAVDLKVSGAPVLFSWPSETGTPIVRVSANSYKKVLENAKTSEPYLAQALQDILASQQNNFDVLAHSMGTLVAFDVLRSRPAKDVGNSDPKASSPTALPNVVLAAPDIGMKHFNTWRDEFIRKSQRRTIYCGPDNALSWSKDVNKDERLGYCKDPKPVNDDVEGLEFVRVYGNFRDVWKHSYYLNVPQVVSDIKEALSTGVDTGASRRSDRPYREIFLNY
ncbi:esterase/lipase superfamily enzyme [Bradyrhizobium sp. USDA 4011]